ncbi:hypothetical protein D3C85_1196870 [compost metagenome]
MSSALWRTASLGLAARLVLAAGRLPATWRPCSSSRLSFKPLRRANRSASATTSSSIRAAAAGSSMTLHSKKAIQPPRPRLRSAPSARASISLSSGSRAGLAQKAL